MRFGALVEGSTFDEITAFVRDAEARCRSSVWMTEGAGVDPLTALALVGQHVDGIELGTAVVRTYPRHPMALAQQALTVSAAVDRRLVLGIGPSHRPSIEERWGMSFDGVMHHLRDYVAILRPLLERGTVDHTGDVLSAHGELHIDAGRPVPLLLAALGPRMLELAGAHADGTITFMTGPSTLQRSTCPTLRAAADRAGRPPPRVVAMLPVVVTDDLDGTRQRLQRALGHMTALPSYAAAVEREGGLPLVAGREDQVEQALATLEAAGVTDVVATRLARRGSDDEARTDALLTRLAGG